MASLGHAARSSSSMVISVRSGRMVPTSWKGGSSGLFCSRVNVYESGAFPSASVAAMGSRRKRW